MTSSLRRKPPITRSGPRSTAPTACSAAAVLLLAGLASAQGVPPAPSPYGVSSATRPVPAPVPPPPPLPLGKPVPAGRTAGVVPAEARTLTFSKDAGRAPEVTPGIMQVQAGELDAADYDIQLDPPDLERLFRLDSEQDVEERVKLKASQRTRPDAKPEPFPQKPPLSNVAYNGRRFAPQTLFAEPAYVAYHRLYFEEVNAERYGWELGLLQPLVSAATFYKDVILLPYHMGSYPCNKHETSAGRCLPGDPVPYLCYPPNLTASGLATEAIVVVGLAAIFP